MKATGIVRRIDDLGRVVIPKEIRRTLRIREGDPLEIYTEKGGEVVFKKYSPVGELGKFATEFAESIYKVNGIPTLVCDKDSVISAVGVSRKDFVEKPLSSRIITMIENKESFVYGNDNSMSGLEAVDNTGKFVSCISPILSEGSAIGAIIGLAKQDNDRPDDSDIRIINTAAEFLSKQIDF
ncbi:MAG: stage V sporulation protein T [Clostridiales bacterium GWF2_38_85]|nr:MAG: stage V sporulation protein T [Clostridiales bacterium GWF2_38_85]HBL83626.1 stage V sporulation protein T [Clostridiales bacterium]